MQSADNTVYTHQQPISSLTIILGSLKQNSEITTRICLLSYLGRDNKINTQYTQVSTGHNMLYNACLRWSAYMKHIGPRVINSYKLKASPHKQQSCRKRQQIVANYVSVFSENGNIVARNGAIYVAVSGDNLLSFSAILWPYSATLSLVWTGH